jgi:hypothetical protein
MHYSVFPREKSAFCRRAGSAPMLCLKIADRYVCSGSSMPPLVIVFTARTCYKEEAAQRSEDGRGRAHG